LIPPEPLIASPSSPAVGTSLLQLPAGTPGLDAAAGLLERCRDYLLLVANAEVPQALRAKVAASDLVQQSIAEAWQDFDRFNGDSENELRAWLRNILLNNLRDAARAYLMSAKRDVAREVSLGSGEFRADGRAIPARDPSPSACASAQEERLLVDQALVRLPESYARVIRLRNLEYLSFAAIAEQMKMDKECARKLWNRAVKRLAFELKQR
jgi:RNA polymerase sigma-70 factor, ECF subfamily